MHLLLSFLKQERKSYFGLCLTIVLIIAATSCSITLPIILQHLIDNLSTKKIDEATYLFFLYACIILLERICGEFQFYFYTAWETAILQTAYESVFKNIFWNKPDFFQNSLSGKITSKLYQAIFGLDLLMFDFVFKILPILFQISLIIFSITFIFDFKMTCLLLIGIISYLACLTIFNNELLAKQNKIRDLTVHAQGMTSDLIHSWKDIKLTQAYSFSSKKLIDETRKITDASKKFLTQRSLYGFLQSLPICFVFITTNYLVISSYLKSSATIGSIILINNYLYQIFKPLESFSLLLRSISKNYADFSQLNEILNYAKEQPPLNHEQFNCLKLENISSHTLRNISLEIKRGDRIAIIGASGSGKTTLLNLLVGFNNEYTGDILLNNINIKYLPENCLRNHIAYLASDARLFNDSIRNNLTFNQNLELTELINYSLMSDKITKLPNALETIISENSGLLSSGEAQRLKIIRTILLNKEIELYDEATSALNSEIEKNILDLILSRAEKTILYITHKTKFLSCFDKVFQLNNGVLINLHKESIYE
jgi:ABC-type multidrug transport system fused ATPase/permease subunit